MDSNLETKLFRIGCLVSVFLCISLAILDGLIFRHPEAVFVELAGLLTFSYFLWLSRNNNSDRVRHIFLALILVFANIAFFIEQGWATPSAIIFFIGILFGTIIIKSKYSRIVAWILIVDFMVLTILEQAFFEESKYLSFSLTEFRIVHVVFAFISIVVTVLLVDFFKIMYDRERFNLNLVNRQLEEANQLLNQKNENLAKTEKSIRENQEVLARNRDELEKVNKEIIEINQYLEKTVRNRKRELSSINNDLSLLFYRSSHDFRRPLTTLKGLARIGELTEQTELSGKILALVDQTADSMGRMLEKFLMLYQINDLQRFPEMSLDEIEKNLRQQVSGYGHIAFEWQLETINYSHTDRRNFLLDIILKNLVENSCFYQNSTNGKINVKITENENQLYISVWDNGEGIAEEIQDKIFTIYYRGNIKSKGAGLGLFVVQNALEKLKGSYQIQSESKKYCQFDIRFKI